jgi:ABC-type sugar transport system ATPase subunit
MTVEEAPCLSLQGIAKSFGSVRALENVGLACRPGRVHALLGANGAGKSTLIGVMTGVHRPDRGTILLDGNEVTFPNPGAAERAGIAAVYQELSLIPHFDVAQNIFIHAEPRRGRWFLSPKKLYAAASELLAALNIAVDPRARVEHLNLAQRQLVEIAKALSRQAQLVIMDEPTASLPKAEQSLLFDAVNRLRERGTSVVYVSHRLEEIFMLADEVTVIKDGRHVRSMPIRETTKRELVELMVGDPGVRRSATSNGARREQGETPAAPALSIRALSSPGKLTDISLDVHPGEIVGVAGLVWSGRTSLLRAVFGADSRARGEVHVGGSELSLGSIRRAIEAGLGFVSEDRKLEGLAMPLTSLTNLVSTGLPGRFGLYDRRAARVTARAVADQMQLSVRALDLPASALSGGNQQKVVVGKWLALEPRVLLCDEPTRGIDVGARAALYEHLQMLASRGMGILFASSELPELLDLSHRIVVLRDGRIVADLDPEDASEADILAAASAASASPTAVPAAQ